MKEFSTRQLLIIGGGIVVFFFFFLWLIWILFFSSPLPQVPSPKNLYPTLSLSLTPTGIPSPTIEIPDQTGGKDIDITEKEERIIEQKYDLRTKLPLSTDMFEITYDYRKFLFYVRFTTVSKEKGKTVLVDWLQEQGYTELTIDMFTFL